MHVQAAVIPASAATAAGMTNRMLIALFALAGMLVSAYLTLYAFGLVGEIACGSGGCQIVQNSPWARFMGVPVALIGLAGYGMLFCAALIGLQPAFEGRRAVAAILLAGAVGGAAFSAYLTYLEAFVIHAWCRWCVVSAVIVGGIVLAAIPEFRNLRRVPSE
jgi:uncharacterized membrane protein